MTARCGTRAGYFRHRRAGEETCQDCRNAHVAVNADRDAARQRAWGRLAREFPERWRELYAEELERRGLQARTPAPPPTAAKFAEVWSDACAPGGYVCGAPDPGKPDGICGMPVEDEPCAEHAEPRAEAAS